MSEDTKKALILEAQAAWREAEEAHQRALSLAAYKQSATQAALNGGVRAVDLATALGITRQRVYRVGHGNRGARDVQEAL